MDFYCLVHIYQGKKDDGVGKLAVSVKTKFGIKGKTYIRVYLCPEPDYLEPEVPG